MVNETDKLKKFLSETTYGFDMTVGPDVADDIRHWLSELLTAWEYIPQLEKHLARIRGLNEKVLGLEVSCQHYVDRHVALIHERERLQNENHQLKTDLENMTANASQSAERIEELEADNERAYLRSRVSALADKVEALDELLCWITALVNVLRPNGIPWEHYVGLLRPLHQLLATLGYTRELIESRGKDNG